MEARRIVDRPASGEVVGVLFSDDGRSLVALSSARELMLWDVERLRLLAIHDLQGASVDADFVAMAWLDERRVVIQVDLSTVLEIDVLTGEESGWSIEGSLHYLGAIGDPPDPTWLSTAAGDYALVSHRERTVLSIALPPGEIQDAFFQRADASQDGRVIGLLTGPHLARWDAIDPSRPPTVEQDPLDRSASEVVDLFGESANQGFSARLPEQLIIGNHGEATIALYDADVYILRDGVRSSIVRGRHQEVHRRWDGLVASIDQRRILAIADSEVSMLDASTGALVWRRPLIGTPNSTLGSTGCSCFRSGALSRDGALAALGTGDGRIMVYDAAGGILRARLGVEAPTWEVRDLAFEGESVVHTLTRQPRGSSMFETDFTPRGLRGDYALATWNLDQTSLARQVDQATERLVTTVHGTFAVEHADSPACEEGIALAQRSVRTGVVESLGCVANTEIVYDVDVESGNVLSAGHYETYVGQPVYLSNLRTGRRVELVAVRAELIKPQHSADGRWFFAFWRERWSDVPMLIDVEHGSTEELPSFVFENGLGPVALTPNGESIVIASGAEIGIYTLPGLELVRSVEANSPIYDLTTDGTIIAASLQDGSMLVVDPEGTRTSTARGSGPMGQLQISPGETRIAAVDRTGVLQVWSVASLSPLASMYDYGPENWLIATPDGHFAGAPEAARRMGWVFEGPRERFDFDRFASIDGDVDAVRNVVRSGGASADGTARTRPPQLRVDDARAESTSTSVTVSYASTGSRVARVTAFVEGRPVDSRGVCERAGTEVFNLPLVRGTNRVSFLAFDSDGVASNPAEIDLEGPAEAERPDIHVVAIGVSRYSHLSRDQQLDFADDDARGVAGAFAALAGEGKPFRSAHVTTLVDQAATPTAIMAALAALARMRPDDVAVVLLAGHGLRPEGQDTMVFLTSDVRGVGDLGGDFVQWRDVAEALERAPGHVLVLVDACHAGDFQRENAVASEALASELTRTGRSELVVFSASRGAEESLEMGTARRGGLSVQSVEGAPPDLEIDAESRRLANHGVFSAAILMALEAPDSDADRDGVLRFSEVSTRVIDHVRAITAGAQTPFVSVRQVFGDMAVVRREARIP